MKIRHYIALSFLVAAVAFAISTSISAGERWYRAQYAGARNCYIEGDNPYKIKEENMCFFPSKKACVATLGDYPGICGER